MHATAKPSQHLHDFILRREMDSMVAGTPVKDAMKQGDENYNQGEGSDE